MPIFAMCSFCRLKAALPEKLGGHFVPPRPVVSKALPYIEKVRYTLDTEPVSQFHILVKQRIVVADHQNMIIAPEAVEKPVVVQTAQVVQWRVQVRIFIIKAVEEAVGDVNGAGHADRVEH